VDGEKNSILHWEQADDGEFIADLLPISARLERAKRVWQCDPQAAKQLVVEHFSGRRAPRWPFDYRRKTADTFPTRNYFWAHSITREEAAAVLNYRVRDPNCEAGCHDLGPDVDWRRGRIHQYGSSGWLVLHFWYWGLFAAAGYAMTRDRRYADVFTKCWHRWHEDFPFYVEPDVVSRGGAFSRADSCMRAGRRMLVLVDVFYSGLLDVLDVGVAFEAIKYVWFVSKQYLRLPMAGGKFVYGFHNHNLFDTGTTPYCIGVMFPEFGHCRRLVDLGKASIRRHVERSIHGDGTSREHSSRYAWYVASMHVQAAEVARLNGDDLLRPSHERKLRKFLWTLVELTSPEGRLIPYGDCQPPPEGLHIKTYRTLFSDEAVRRRAAALCVSLSDVHAPTSICAHDEPPGLIRRAWRVFRDSGMVIVRDGIGRRASLLWIIADPRGRTAHGHLDFTSFQLWTRGVPLVHDTSGYAYRIENVVSGERAHYYSPFGHSVLTVDEYSPVPMEQLGDVHSWWGNEIPKAVIQKTRIRGVTGHIVCSHEAYPGMKVERTFAFDLGACWVEVTDRVRVHESAQGYHVFQQIFHLGFGVVPRPERSQRRVHVKANGVGAKLEWDASAALTLTVRKNKFVKRAAKVFGLDEPYVLAAKVATDDRNVEISCRIQWA